MPDLMDSSNTMLTSCTTQAAPLLNYICISASAAVQALPHQRRYSKHQQTMARKACI
jgi:hypothetical protein